MTTTLHERALEHARAEPLLPARTGWRKVALILAATDMIALLIALPLAVELMSALVSGSRPLDSRWWIFLAVPFALPFLASYRLYDGDRRKITISSLGELFATFNALSIYGFLLLVVMAGSGQTEKSLAIRELVTFWLLGLVTIPLARTAARRIVIPRAAQPQRTLIIGAGHVGQAVARKIASRPDFNLEVVGFLDNQPQPLDPDLKGVEVLGNEGDLVRVARETKAERIILCFSRMPHEEILEIVRRSGLDRLYISVVPRFFEIMASNVVLDDVAGIPVLGMQPARLSRVALFTKRATDLLLTSLALPLLAPIALAIAVAIKLDSRGPVFFRQTRMGRHGRVFRIFKFRTMVPDAEHRREELLGLNEVTGPLFKLRRDPRVTRVGSFLRRTSLDELPQLLNVLKGEMSLVGPRPFVTYEAEEIHGWARRRVDLIPGITGAWQVHGRNDMPFEEMVKLDYLYVTNWSLAWDLKLLLQTVPVVLRRKGAY